MKIGRYTLLSPLGAGPDGTSYRAELSEEHGTPETVELRLLADARADPRRWSVLSKRLRTAALLQHPGAVAVRELRLDADPPFIALAWTDPVSLAERLPTLQPAMTVPDVIHLGRQLMRVLGAAHRLGLTHIDLGPHAIFGEPADIRLDFTGLHVRASPSLEEISAFRPPEEASGNSPRTPKGDLYGAGAVLFHLLTGDAPESASSAALDRSAIPVPLQRLVLELLDPDPEHRPRARDAAQRLTALQAPLGATVAEPESSPDVPSQHTETSEGPPSQVGRFRLLEKLGQGGMGSVYRAEDLTDGTIVALKLLRADWAANPQHLRRFHKEARLLAEVSHPNVTSLLEVNEDNGLYYLILEFVEGPNLDSWLEEHGRMEERPALTLIADVARGLAHAHEAGIVHRDIKPANILLSRLQLEKEEKPPSSQSTIPKLTDFGLARHVIESESLNVTHAGAILGTPLYMAPEQCGGEAVDARADVYSLGATLYHLLAGRPPFDAASPLALIASHRNDPLPPLRQFNPAVSEAVCLLIDKAMAKRPEGRYADAGEMLAELERLLRGEPSSIAVHPRLPDCNPARVLHYDFTWQLDASPEQLWPHVSNTERLNRAIGMSGPKFSVTTEEEGAGKKRVHRRGYLRKAGMTFDWEEHPFEWIEARRMGVLREYSSGPFRWMISIVELQPRAGSGTSLTHRLRLEPRGLLGRTLAAVEVGMRTRRSLEQVYRRIDHVVSGRAADPDGAHALLDPFEDSHQLSKTRRRRLESLLDVLLQQGLDPLTVERFGDFLASAPPQEVARIRPLALARRLRLDPEAVTAICLHGARAGLLVLLWDILCPICRIPAQVIDTLKSLRQHGRCEACQLDFELDFAGSVEMIFRAHPEVRESELATYCIGGPAHSPHVAAQARVGAGERIELGLSLGEGTYRIRGPQLPRTLEFRVEAEARAGRWELLLSQPAEADRPRILRAGSQVLALTNDGNSELLVRVERTAPRTDALTAARASSLALFRELFPGEALSPGQLISVTTLTFLVVDLTDAERLYREHSDAQAFGVLQDYFRLARESVVREGGAVVKTVGEGILAVFSDPSGAVRAGLTLPGLLAGTEATNGLSVRIACHRGPALAATIGDQLDYFGATLSQAMRLPASASGGEMVLSQTVCCDPGVAALLQSRQLHGSMTAGPLGMLLRRFSLT